jgi:signal transduction histidine kinase
MLVMRRLRMSQTIVIDDGTSFKQQEFNVSNIAQQLARAIQSLSNSTDPAEIETRLLMAVQDLLKPCSATLTTLREEGAVMTRTVDVDGKIYSGTDLARLKQVNYGIVPKNSVTARIAKTGHSILWEASEENEKNEWLRTPMLIGVPWFGKDGQIAGALVASLFRAEMPTEDHVFFLQTIAEAFSAAYVLAAEYQEMVKKAQSAERERLNQLIHDSVAQDIFSMQLKIREILGAGAAADPVRQGLAFLQSQLDSTRASLRQIISSDMHSEIDGLTISELARAEIQRHEGLGGPAVAYLEDSLPEASKRHQYVVRSLLREGLCNVRKHASASLVSVRVLASGDSLVVSVMDDGKGLAAPSDESGANGLRYGIESLRRLVESLGGSLLLSDVEEGGGALMRASIPLGGARP